MKNENILDAIGMINEEAVRDAKAYQRPKSRNWVKWGTVAACLCLVLAGIFPLFNQPSVSPFVLTAYALENDNGLSAVAMKEGENIPVSLFEADNGLWGFVFSHEADDPEQPISISIINADQRDITTEHIKAIIGLEMDSTQNYVFFVPPQNEAGPYNLPLTIHDDYKDTVAQLTVVIEKAEDGYTARIGELLTHPRKEAP